MVEEVCNIILVNMSCKEENINKRISSVAQASWDMSVRDTSNEIKDEDPWKLNA